MLSNKLTTLLQSFSSSELLRFQKFVDSPYFNENKDLKALFNLLYRNLRVSGKAKKDLDKLGLWRALFGNKSYEDALFRRMCSDLTKLAQEFLAVQQFRQHPFTPLIGQLKNLSTPKLEKHFNGVLRQLNATQQKMGHRNADFHFHHYQMEWQQHLFLDHSDAKANDLAHLQTADYHLDVYYIVRKLRHLCTLLVYKSVRSIEKELRVLPDFIKYVESSVFFKEPVVQIYLTIFHLYLLEEENSYPYFLNLKKLLEQYGGCFSSGELQRFYLIAQNYCASQLNLGQVEFYKELFLIYKSMIESELIIKEGELEQGLYKNITTVGLIVEEFDWVENFIQTYTQKLSLAHQENALNYNLAKVYFHQKQYNKVIEQLREVEYKNLIYALGGKLMLLKTYYELKEYLTLDSLIDSFRIYLRRNRFISKEVRQQYMNVLRFTKKLATLAPYDKKGALKVKQQIEECKALAAKKWLLEKVEQIA